MTPPDSTLPEEDYLNKVSKQKAAYNELAQFEPGQGGLQYFPVPKEEHDNWQKEYDKKKLAEWEAKEDQKKVNNNSVLDLRTEEPRSNGHDKPQVTLYEGHPSLTNCNYCNNTVGQCNCKDNPRFDKIINPDHCELKKIPKKKRASSSKKK